MEASSDHCLGFTPVKGDRETTVRYAADCRENCTTACDVVEPVVEFRYDISDQNQIVCSSARLTPLTGQLSSYSLEWQLSELLDQRSELGAADQLMFTIVQLVDRHQSIAQNSLHQHTVPAERGEG